MVLIQRRAYVDLVQGSVIDIAISPQQATISRCSAMCVKPILSAFHHCAAVSQKPLKLSRTVMKVLAGGGRASMRLSFRQAQLLAPSRGNDVMIANDNLRIEQGDHVIMFLTDKKFITDVERLFQPSPFFL
jgi:trk system potassium uptake protein TrkA